MSPSQAALSTGFSALLAASGEALTLRRTPTVSLTGIVDRTPDRARYGQELSFDEERASVIEVFQTAATPAPRVGEDFLDANQVYHRVQRVRALDGFKLRCFCSASK